MDTLILIPGLGSDAAVWERTIQALGPDVDCRVGDTFSDDSLPAMAARILAQAPPRFALAGVSMGGMVALEILKQAPERVTRLAMIDTNARPDTPEAAEQRLRNNTAVATTPNYRMLATMGLRFLVHPGNVDDTGQALVEMSVRVGPDAYVRQNNAVLARDDLRPGLATIQVPTIVVVGDSDAMTPLDRAEEIRDGIAGAVLHVIPDCGHLPPIEKPQALAHLLRAWLTATP